MTRPDEGVDKTAGWQEGSASPSGRMPLVGACAFGASAAGGGGVLSLASSVYCQET